MSRSPEFLEWQEAERHAARAADAFASAIDAPRTYTPEQRETVQRLRNQAAEKLRALQSNGKWTE